MSISNSQISYVYANNLFSILKEEGIAGICVSPGFRNSTLILAAHKILGEKTYTHIDERGAAYFALGLAKATGKAAVIVCTSGTAAANYFPAILEAHHANIPLLVITADRPYEMIGVGANQSMKQTNLYGDYVRDHISIPAPIDSAECLRHLQFTASRLLACATGIKPGPVHLNIAFREPFLASEEEISEIPKEYFQLPRNFHQVANDELPRLPKVVADAIEKSNRPCLAIGPGEFTATVKEKILLLAKKAQLPIFAEASSGLISTPGIEQSREALFRFDHYLRSPQFNSELWPDLVIRIGAPLTSKFFHQLLAKTQAPQIILDIAEEFRNPVLNGGIFISSKASDAAKLLLDHQNLFHANADWKSALAELEAQTEASLNDHISQEMEFTEWGWLRNVAPYLEPNSAIFLGNSMPIRDWDAVFPRKNQEHQIFCNRGLSGIDGILSTALGIAAGELRPVHLFVGDLTALHDINSLSLAKRIQEKIRLTIWIHNNFGGEIFRTIPTSKADAPQEWFTTPQYIDLSSIVKGFQLSYLRVHKLPDLNGIDSTALCAPGVRVIELCFPAEENTAIRKNFWNKFH